MSSAGPTGTTQPTRLFSQGMSKYAMAPPRPSPNDTDWHLTEALCKPLHHFDEAELSGLIRELQHSGYEQREADIQRAVEEIMRVCSGGTAGYDPYTMLPSNRMMFELPMRDRLGNHHHLRVVLPSWTPAQYIKPLAERMIRDQLEEG